MNIRDKNAEDREFIYAKNKFWSEEPKEVFKTTVASYYGIEAVTTKKALNHLIREKALLDKALKCLEADSTTFGILTNRNIKSEIKRINTLREAITASMSKVNDFDEYELVIVNNAESGNGKPYSVESFADFMHKITHVYKLAEITQEQHVRNKKEERCDMDRFARLQDDYHNKTGIVNMLMVFIQIFPLMILLEADFKMVMESPLTAPLSIALPFWWIFIQPLIIKKLIKKPA
ncbi:MULTISPECIES: hypothetical protein [Pseudomonas]|uniref:hypothetical protein n=1 Tax=Pseudomonas TaxID=286 RepID=UPI000FC3FBC5|nr:MULTISPECIES: hypothetical protein [Pseudomonas]RUE17086.1 hypothetical protein IPC1222_25580 [Pseudomonas aeruginosa]CAH0133903.1 hypothetical protein SRABI111_00286 [Pseudomonas carnis]CAH0136809.1 hypothetical protein SRABI110_00430 [Pseudomonas carnis]CAH0160338.1 hypothetical protein SRABI64_00762 [Pseudomonas carnis]CAH0199778.1 hypothetical protein SRABI08_01864 [Pseudomonas carnis]